MIISASRRTDIPAFYSEWFFNRLREGYALVRNPMNPSFVSRVALDPQSVDCIVFWTKDPSPMLDKLHQLDDYNYYFQFTINPYGQDIEGNVPRKNKLIDTFRRLSDKIGYERVLWRYSPIAFSGKMDVAYHTEYFDKLCRKLEGYTEKCLVSFMDIYKKTERNLRGTDLRKPSPDEIRQLCANMSSIGPSHGISLQTCGGDPDNDGFLPKGKCIDEKLIGRITGLRAKQSKDKNQRKTCLCAESADIGEYDTCPHECLYCYANNRDSLVMHKWKTHDPASPLLFGNLKEGDTVRERKISTIFTK